MGSALQVALATAGYAVLHSLLLTNTARLGLEAAFGRRAVLGCFRLGYNAVAAVLLVALVAYAARLPDVPLVRVPGPAAWGLWAAKVAAVGFIVSCVRRVGAGGFLGLAHCRAWRQGGPVPGPGVETGPLVTDGPYRRVRHPMYAAGFVVLWADPVWTANRVAFAGVLTVYLWLGALIEERRLARSFGTAYRRYAAATPRFFPRLLGGKPASGPPSTA